MVKVQSKVCLIYCSHHGDDAKIFANSEQPFRTHAPTSDQEEEQNSIQYFEILNFSLQLILWHKDIFGLALLK